MIDEVASDPGSENQNRNWWQHFGNWISEHGDEHGFIETYSRTPLAVR